jgi:hypothetical protein
MLKRSKLAQEVPLRLDDEEENLPAQAITPSARLVPSAAGEELPEYCCANAGILGSSAQLPRPRPGSPPACTGVAAVIRLGSRTPGQGPALSSTALSE